MGVEWNNKDFSDIWDTESDPARIWGTKEYFNRVDRKGWHAERDPFADKTQRIKRKADEDIERIKANAEKIKRDAQRIAETARKAAENVRSVGSSRSSTSSRSSVSSFEDMKKSYNEYLMRSKPAGPQNIVVGGQSKKKKKKKKKERRFKLSSKSGGITLGGSLFWMFIVYQCFFAGNDKDEKTANITSTTDKVVEQVQTTIDKIRPEAQALIDKAKGEFSKSKVANNSDPFAQDDDRYGSIEDKW